jgi:hypothetical protein
MAATRPCPVRVYGRTFRVKQEQTVEAAKANSAGFCPHCRLLVEPGVGEGWPREPVRCHHCHLLIGVGRGQAEPGDEPGTKGTAAGVFSRQAKREGEATDFSPGEVLEAIRDAARELGEPPERLLMVDYQQVAAANADLPQLSDVFAAFGSWKGARREAASELSPADDG